MTRHADCSHVPCPLWLAQLCVPTASEGWQGNPCADMAAGSHLLHVQWPPAGMLCDMQLSRILLPGQYCCDNDSDSPGTCTCKSSSRVHVQVHLYTSCTEPSTVSTDLSVLRHGWCLHCQGCDIVAREKQDVAPRHIIGVALWAVGWSVNLHSDHILRALRKPGQRGGSQ